MKLGKPIAVRIQPEIEKLIQSESERKGMMKATLIRSILNERYGRPKKGDSISLMGFGSFKVVERAAREGRNPSTGEKIKIAASKGVKFSPGANLKERVNK